MSPRLSSRFRRYYTRSTMLVRLPRTARSRRTLAMVSGMGVAVRLAAETMLAGWIESAAVRSGSSPFG